MHAQEILPKSALILPEGGPRPSPWRGHRRPRLQLPRGRRRLRRRGGGVQRAEEEDVRRGGRLRQVSLGSEGEARVRGGVQDYPPVDLRG